jgi:hypothetical protein
MEITRQLRRGCHLREVPKFPAIISQSKILAKLVTAQLDKKLADFHEIRKYITDTQEPEIVMSQINPIHIPLLPTTPRSPSVSPTITLYAFPVLQAPQISPSFDHPITFDLEYK